VTLVRALVLVAGFLLGACQRAKERVDESRDTLPDSGSAPLVLQLVDAVAYANDSEEGFLYRVEARRGTRTDTIPGVLTLLKAVAEGDSLIHGFRFDALGILRHAFRFSLPRRRLDTLPLPADLLPQVSYPALASDGRHLAYARFDTNGTARGIVRRWPSLELVLETPSVAFVPGDMLAGAAEWKDDRTFTIYIDPFNDGSNRWARFRGQLGATYLEVDTIPLGGHPESDEK
jgi:hypothetical protein